MLSRLHELGLEELLLVLLVTDCICLLAIDFVGVEPRPEVKRRDLGSVNPVEVVVVDGFLDDLDRIFELKLAAQAEPVLCCSNNIHLAILFVVCGIEVATDHGREDRRLVNQLRVFRPGLKVNTALRRHLKVEALSNELSPALRELVDVSIWAELVGMIRCLKLVAKHLFIRWVETLCLRDVL